MPRMPWARKKKGKDKTEEDSDEPKKVRGREGDRCMLDPGTQCPLFVAFGSGSGINRTIICCNTHNGRPSEKYMGEARRCLSEKRLIHESSNKRSR